MKKPKLASFPAGVGGFPTGSIEGKVVRMYALFLLGFKHAAEAVDHDQDSRRAMGVEGLVEGSTSMKTCRPQMLIVQCALCMALERRLIAVL